MKNQAELNAKHEVLKAQCAELVKVLEETELGKQILDKALVALHGRTHGAYGDTSMPRNRRLAEEAQTDLIHALKDVIENSKPQKQRIDDEKLYKVRDKCRDTLERGGLMYEIIVGGDPVEYFKAKDLAAAKKFAKSLRLGKHEVKRVTKGERDSRSLAYLTSPESETYWSS